MLPERTSRSTMYLLFVSSVCQILDMSKIQRCHTSHTQKCFGNEMVHCVTCHMRFRIDVILMLDYNILLSNLHRSDVSLCFEQVQQFLQVVEPGTGPMVWFLSYGPHFGQTHHDGLSSNHGSDWTQPPQYSIWWTRTRPISNETHLISDKIWMTDVYDLTMCHPAIRQFRQLRKHPGFLMY